MQRTVLSPEQKEGICIVSGFTNPELTTSIAHDMGMPVTPLEARTFPNSELYVRIQESVREKRVFIVQAHHNGTREVDGEEVPYTINDALMENILMVQAAATSSAKEVTAVIPHFGYARSDRKSQGREAIGVAAVISCLAAVHVDRVVASDLHSHQSSIGFTVLGRQFDHITALPTLFNSVRNEIANYDLYECVMVSPDAGSAKLAQHYQDKLNIEDLVYVAKKRKRGSGHEISRTDRVGEVNGKVCIIVDDMIDTAGTMVTTIEVLNKSGAKAIIVAASHGLFSGKALERLKDAPLDRVIVTDTVPQRESKKYLGDRLHVAPIAPTIGRVLVEIAAGGSVSRVLGGDHYR